MKPTRTANMAIEIVRQRMSVFAIVAFAAAVAVAADTPPPSLLNKEAEPTKAAIKDTTQVREGGRVITVTAESPIPADVSDKEKAQAIAKDAAVSVARSRLMLHIQSKRTHKKKTLEEAEIPSLELQQKVRDLVAGAEIVDVTWKKDACAVTISLSKLKLGKILRES